MMTATTIAQTTVRAIAPIIIILGLLFWTDTATFLVPVHMLLGIVIVLSLWTLALLAARAGVNLGFVALALVWGLVVPVLGVTQERLLPGSEHWLIQILHLLVGLGAIGQAEGLARGIKARQQPSRDQSAQALGTLQNP